MMRHAWDLPAPRARALGRGHPGSDHRAAPVDAQVLAGDHGGVLAREVGDQRGDLLRRDEAAGGDLLPRRLALLPDPDLAGQRDVDDEIGRASCREREEMAGEEVFEIISYRIES